MIPYDIAIMPKGIEAMATWKRATSPACPWPGLAVAWRLWKAAAPLREAVAEVMKA